MLDPHRLPSAVIAATFALSGVVATSGVVSVATGVGGSSAFCDVHADRPAGDILDCLGESTGYISTPMGSGSGLVLEDGYLLTNAHVVDPFETVTVTMLHDGEKQVHEDVKVVGVDLFADIAVIGPIETDARPVELTDPKDLKDGSQLFLVGYPGEANAEDLKPTVADGILSRTRSSEGFGLHYLQTDASIGGGQSGGALVDREGGVVGISSLRFAENFALALSGSDALASVTKILAGQGSTYQSFPGGTPVSEASVEVPGDYDDGKVLNIPAAKEDRTVDVEVPAEAPLILVSSSIEDEDALQVMGNARAIIAAVNGIPYSSLRDVPFSELHDRSEEDTELAEELAPGKFRFKVPGGRHVVIALVTPAEATVTANVKMSLPFVPVNLSDPEPVALELGHQVEDVVGTLVPYDAYKVHLEAGQKVRVEASAPANDMRVVVRDPSGDRDEVFEDSRVGLYGVDVDETFEAKEAGDYTFEVGQDTEHPTGYHFTVTAK